MSIAPGSRLGPYRIETLVGEGGMGQVYRGSDTRLDRTVAIKVLSRHLASDPQLRERFDREARAISSLSHPNICSLFDVGHDDSVDFLVMEYLEGESLADRLARGPLPIEQVLRYGSQIAEALAAAHRHGVVHRDLKPGNVMLSKSGAKLLDFGLAKTVAAVLPVPSPDSLTEHHRPLTQEGTLIGTFQYMAPEQVEGREADTRTDIFALGVLLYEMTTGKRPFEGKSKASLIASILEREPEPVSAVQPEASGAMERLIRACMAKEPDERVQAAHDVAMQLAWIRESSRDEQPRRSRRRWVWIAAACALVIAAAATTAAFWRTRDSVSTAPAMNLSLLPPPGFRFGAAALAPDGTLAFTASDAKGLYLFTRRLDESRPRQLTRIWYWGKAFWSPDGKWIAYFDQNRLMKIPAAGGPAETICTSSYGVGGAWSDDGTIVFTPGYFQPLHTVPASGGVSRPLTRLDAKRKEAVHAWPTLLPERKGVLYLAVPPPGTSRRIVHVSLDGKRSRDVLEADGLVGYSAPYLLFVREANIYAVRFDADAARVVGQPARVAEQVAYSQMQDSADASVTPDGTLIFPPQVPQMRRLVWYDRTGRSLGVLLEEDGVRWPNLSPDGQKLLFTKSVRERGTQALYSLDIARGIQTLLTPPPAFGGWAGVWLPDGERLAFSSVRRSGAIDLFVQEEDPQAAAIPILESDTDDKVVASVTPDGQHLLVAEYTPSKLYDIWMVPISGKGERKLLLGSAGSEQEAEMSPDGRWIVYELLQGVETDIYVRAVSGGRATRVSTSGGDSPHWSRDGKEIYYVSRDRVLSAVSVGVVNGAISIGLPVPLFKLDSGADTEWALSPDGKKFLINEIVDPASAVRPYTVLTGWKQKLQNP